MATSTVANWLSNFLISATFLTVVAVVSRAGAFWIYAGLGVLAFVFFLARLPETRGRTLEEIEAELGADVEAGGDGQDGHARQAEEQRRHAARERARADEERAAALDGRAAALERDPRADDGAAHEAHAQAAERRAEAAELRARAAERRRGDDQPE